MSSSAADGPAADEPAEEDSYWADSYSEDLMRRAVGVMCPQQLCRLSRALACHPMLTFPILESWLDPAGVLYCRIRGESAQYVITWKGARMTCTCPDWKKHCVPGRLVCKHCCSVVLELAGVGTEVGRLLQVIAGSHVEPTSSALVYDAPAPPGEECPICYDALTGHASGCSKCPACSKVFHRDCIGTCLKHDPRCPWCRGQTWDGFWSSDPRCPW